MYNQGIELLISSKKNIRTQLDDTEKSYIDSGVESSSNDFNSISDLKNFSENFLALPDPNNNSEMVVLKQETGTGYCIDSVEPKCSELKRLIDEFKSNYFKKLNGLRNNKLLVQKINLAKQTFERGTKLFQDQDLINMSPERKRKYSAEIEEWLSDYYKLDLNKCEAGSEDETVTLSSFDMDANTMTDCAKNHQTNVEKNFEIVCSQLKSLGQMFEKRKEQLNKACVVSRPVQRVEPQQIFDQNNLMNRIHDTFRREIKRDKTKIFETNFVQDNSKPKRTLSNADSSQIAGFLKKNPRKFSHGTLKSRKLSNDSSSSSINDNEDDEILEQKKMNEKKIR